MSRPTISSGTIPFNRTKSGGEQSVAHDQAMHIVLLGDFTGRTAAGRLDSDSVGQRRLIEIDRDNFEDVFRALDIQLSLPVAPEPLVFAEFDDLHPDFLYEKLPLFAELRSLQRRLKKAEHFAAAASEIRQWAGYSQEAASSGAAAEVAAATPSGVPIEGDLLDAVLASSDSIVWEKSEGENIDRLIKDIVAPYVRDKADPELPELLDAVASAGNQLMRRICHTSDFQQLEASWRSVYLLIRRLETGPNLKIYLADIAREELQQDLESCAGELEQSGIYQLLVERHQIPGATPPSLINLDYYVDGSEADISLLSAMGSVAAENGAAVMCGARSILAGCENISESADPDAWFEVGEPEQRERWQALRQLAQSQRIALAAPRFLLRLPYGKQTSPLESFDYTELPDEGAHPYYLWGNSAYLVTLLLASSYINYGWSFKPGQLQVVDDFPAHVYTDSDGDTQVKPCAEVMLTDRAAGKLQEAGLLAVRSIKGQADIGIFQFDSLAESHRLRGPWGE